MGTPPPQKGDGYWGPQGGQAATGPSEACLRHRRHQKWRRGADDVWGHRATWREFRLPHPPQCPEGALESEVRLAARGHVLRSHTVKFLRW